MKRLKSLFISDIVETLIVSFVVITIIYSFLAMPELVWGASMEPNYHTGERILVEKVTKNFKPFVRGDVVVLHPPENDNIDYIKRIIGVPGDIIKVLDCRVYVSRDGVRYELQEDYLATNTCTSEGPSLQEGRSLKIPDGSYLVLGDNRSKSLDSRVFGVIAEDKIIGRVVFRFWPIDKFGFTNIH